MLEHRLRHSVAASIHYLLVRPSHAVFSNYQAGLGQQWHFLDLLLVLDMLAPVGVVTPLVQDRLLVKKTFGEGVILLLDSLCFTLASKHIETCWSLLRGSM